MYAWYANLYIYLLCRKEIRNITIHAVGDTDR